MIIPRSVLLKMRNVLDKSCRENQNTHFEFSNFFFENRAVYEIMWQNILETSRPQIKIWRMCIACWITKAIDTNSDYVFFSHGATIPSGPGPPHCRGFTITLRHTTLGRTPLDAWLARRRDLYLTTYNNRNRHPCPRRDSNPQSQQASGRRPTP